MIWSALCLSMGLLLPHDRLGHRPPLPALVRRRASPVAPPPPLHLRLPLVHPHHAPLRTAAEAAHHVHDLPGRRHGGAVGAGEGVMHEAVLLGGHGAASVTRASHAPRSPVSTT